MIPAMEMKEAADIQSAAVAMPLAKGETPPPVAFDQAGVVTLGCNIHDHMRGFIVVADSPFHGVTDDAGRIELDVPAGVEPGLLHLVRVEVAQDRRQRIAARRAERRRGLGGFRGHLCLF